MALDANDRWEISELISRYNLAADERDVEAFLANYTNDGVIEGDMRTGAGRDAMRADLPGIFAMEGTLKRHLVTNLRFDQSDDPGRATVHYILLVVEGETLPAVGATTRVTDELRRVDGRWLVERHHLKVDPAMFNALRQGRASGTWTEPVPQSTALQEGLR